MSDEAVVFDGLVKRFDKSATAIAGLSARLGGGHVTGLVGPDGAGKTTLMRLIAGLLLPSEGRIEVCGFDTRRARRRIHRVVSYMPQRFGLYEDLTVMREPQSLRRPARRGRSRAPPGLRAAAAFHRSRLVYRPARRAPVRRHEAEARPRLRADLHAEAAAARRAERRRRSDLAPRTVADGVRRWWNRASPWSGAPPISTRRSAAPTCCCSTRAS